MFAFRPLLRFAQRPCLPGIHIHAMPVFRPALIPTWRPCFARHLYSPGDHISTSALFRLTPCPHDARASPSAHVCLAFAFRPLLRFGRCPASPSAHANTMLMLRPAHMSTRHPYPSGVPDSSGAHAWPDVYAHLALMLRPVPMFAQRSCSPDVHVSPDAQGRSRRHIPYSDLRSQSPMTRIVQHA